MINPILIAWTIISCISAVTLASEDEAADLLQADRLFQATLFEDSKECYQVLLNRFPNGPEALKIRARLIENLYLLKNDQEALKIAQESDFLNNRELRGLYFHALTLWRLGQENEAAKIFESYLKSGEGQQRDEVQLAVGQIYLNRGELTLAAASFEAIQKPNLYLPAQLNLVKVYFKKEEFKEAQRLLEMFLLVTEDPLKQEHAFLSGLVAMQLQQFLYAIQWLEKAPSTPETLYQLGWAHLMNSSFTEAETAFQKLLKTPLFKEQALLALAQCAISEGLPQKAEKWLSEIPAGTHIEEHTTMLLLKARSAPTFEERESIYRALTEGSHPNHNVWIERGLHAWKEERYDLAERSFEQALQKLNDKSRALYLMGQLLFQQKKQSEAEKRFLQLVEDYPQSPLIGEALLFLAKCSEGEKGREYRRKVFDGYPHTDSAAEAYFTYYPYREYVQGERAAIKHLQQMRHHFPDSPYLITAYYLIGMDDKRDRKNAQGKWIRKRNMMDAIDALQESESLFEELDSASKIPNEERDFYVQVHYRAMLERALGNLHIAEESQGAKQSIFLQYAADLFDQMRNRVKDNLPLLEECTYWLAQTSIKAHNDPGAEKILLEMLNHSQSAYYRSRAKYELAMIAMRSQNYKQALHLFAEAEKTGQIEQNQKIAISPDQKIDLWIQQSLCHRELGEYDQSMLILSQAINDSSISSLRVKAMYLRAEIYALQGRHDLAHKQLLATAKKGGEWALKAKQKVQQKVK